MGYLTCILSYFIYYISAYTIPNYVISTSITTTSLGTLLKAKSFNNFIGRLSTTGRLDLWNINNISNQFTLSNGTGILSGLN